MPKYLDQKIKIGISACVFGCPVRYNKKGFDLLKGWGREKADYIWYPVCPESAAGLGVPRSPIRIIGHSGHDIWNNSGIIKNRDGKNVTDDIKFGCNSCLETLKRAGVFAYIYMEGSPSCGVYRTTLRNRRLGSPPGVFGSLLLSEGFFLIPALDMESPLKAWDCRRRLKAFAWVKEVEIKNKRELFDFWHTIKFLCQEVDEKEARSIGFDLANSPKILTEEYINDLKHKILMILRKPSSTEKIKNRLWKHYVYLKRKAGIDIENIMDPSGLRNITHIANEVMEIEKKSKELNLLFGSSPIL